MLTNPPNLQVRRLGRIYEVSERRSDLGAGEGQPLPQLDTRGRVIQADGDQFGGTVYEDQCWRHT